MQINIIDNIKQFDELRDNWNVVYASDPDVTIHRSWIWLKGWIECTSYDWIVLAIRCNSLSSYVAFMVLGINNSGTLYIGGHPQSAHTGFICLPEYAEQIIPDFSDFIQKRLKWNRFEMRDVLDSRLDNFLKYFSPRKYNLNRIADTPCPYTYLPNTWEKYLQEFLGSKTRKRLKYELRRIERDNEIRETKIQSDNLHDHIEILLNLMQRRWGQKSKQHLNTWRAIMRHTFRSDSLWLNILWHNSIPITAMGAFVDRNKNFSFFMTGYDDQYAKLSPGTVMIARSIQYAIRNGFSLYDFGRGNSDYKFSFGAKERFNTNVIIECKTIRTIYKGLTNRVKRKLKRVVNF